MKLFGALRAASLFIVASLCLGISTLAQAMTADQASHLLAQLHQMRIESYLAINAFYNYSTNTGDKSLAAEAKSATQRIENRLTQISNAPEASEIPEAISPLKDHWKRYRGLLNTNIKEVTKQGYTDLRLTIEMSEANLAFVRATGEAMERLKKSTGHQPSELLLNVREATLQIAHLMTAYAARSSSNVAQVAQGAETEKPLDVLAREFTDRLTRLGTITQADTASRKVVDDITTKWNFIQNSYINYNENNVSYIVDLYSKRILDSLRKLEESVASA